MLSVDPGLAAGIDRADLPLVQAPMAGGPSCPALAIAVARAGGIGSLAAGYLAPAAIADQVREVTAAGVPCAVNIFLPDPDRPDDADEVAAYREDLLPLATSLGVELPRTVDYTDDDYREKVELMAEERVALTSFTFGCPEAWMVDLLHSAGSAVVGTVTSVEEADAAAAVGVDVLCVQGTEAGGHRATFDQQAPAPETGTRELLGQVREHHRLPVIAAGGVSTDADVADLLAAGAAAVQVGTAWLLADEAGTSVAHRTGLAQFVDRPTVLTRAYSGRQARGIRNTFISAHDASAPAAYPRVNTLTRTLRRAAADDPEVINLWAGTGFRHARTGPVADVLRSLLP